MVGQGGRVCFQINPTRLIFFGQCTGQVGIA